MTILMEHKVTMAWKYAKIAYQPQSI